MDARAEMIQWSDVRTRQWLLSAGWYMSDDGWRNKRLNGGAWPWPPSMAVQLQSEADKGGNDLACKMLRGEP